MEGESVYEKYKSSRLLVLYTRLLQGDSLVKSEEAARFGVDEKSIQRDISDLRAFLANQVANGESDKELIYDRKSGSYRLCAVDQNTMTNSEILAVCKILLDSRTLCRSEMEQIIQKLLNACVPKENQKRVKALIGNELFHYIEPHHGKAFVKDLWEIGAAVQEHRILLLQYEKQDGTIVERKVQPVGIMVSEYYFYLTAYIADIDKQTEFQNPDDKFPTIYRIDRIRKYSALKERFNIPYADRFEEGEFRKRVQFMYGGKLRKIRFKYTGKNVEAVLDRLPTARIEEKTYDGYILTAEVFGDGIDMWVRSQGERIELFNL